MLDTRDNTTHIPPSFRENQSYSTFFFGFIWQTAAERRLRDRYDALREYALDIQGDGKPSAFAFLHQQYGLIEATKQYDSEGKENPDFIKLNRYITALSYGILQFDKNITFVHDYVNGETQTELCQAALGPAEIDEAEKIASQRMVIDNNIRLFSLNLLGQSWFSFRRFWIDYHDKPFTHMLYVGILTAFFIYLQSGILNFTPFSTILLTGMLVTAIPLVSTFCYVNISRFIRGQTMKAINRTVEEGEQISLEQVTLLQVLSHLFSGRVASSILLWTTALLSGSYFILATSNSLAFSCFLTSSAVSFLPFATTLWGCFACSAIAMIFLYAINREFVSATNTEKEVEKPPYNILGIQCHHRSLVRVMLYSAAKLHEAGRDLLYPTIEDAQKMLAIESTAAALPPTSSSALTEPPIAVVASNDGKIPPSANTGCVIS